MSFLYNRSVSSCQKNVSFGAVAGGLPCRAAVGGLPAACSKLHILSEKSDNKKQEQKKQFKQFYSPAASSRFYGSPDADRGDVYQFAFWRTSARISRMVKNPKYIERNEKTILSDIQIETAGRYLDDQKNSNDKFKFKSFTNKQIQKAFNGSSRGKIDSFSDRSRARLKHVAGNSFPHLISQFCLTYGNTVIPNTGTETKKHLHNFLVAISRKYPGSCYLWILEFQTRKVAHFHIFFSFPPCPEKQEWMTRKWLKIVGVQGEDYEKMYKVHNFKGNFINWNMKKGGYLTKYLSKESQKHVPQGFQDVGRFWGNTRNLVPPPERLIVENGFLEYTSTDKITGETSTTDTGKELYRLLRRHHESVLRSVGIKRKSRLRNMALTNVNLPSGGLVIIQYLAWIEKNLQVQGFDLTITPF